MIIKLEEIILSLNIAHQEQDHAARDQQAHELLREWGMWSRERAKPGRCRSIEHRYQPERGDIEPTPPALPVLDYPAIDVERAIVHPAFPIIWRALLKGAYVLRCPDDGMPSLVRKLTGKAIRVTEVRVEIQRARLAVINRLRA